MNALTVQVRNPTYDRDDDDYDELEGQDLALQNGSSGFPRSNYTNSRLSAKTSTLSNAFRQMRHPAEEFSTIENGRIVPNSDYLTASYSAYGSNAGSASQQYSAHEPSYGQSYGSVNPLPPNLRDSQATGFQIYSQMSRSVGPNGGFIDDREVELMPPYMRANYRGTKSNTGTTGGGTGRKRSKVKSFFKRAFRRTKSNATTATRDGVYFQADEFGAYNNGIWQAAQSVHSGYRHPREPCLLCYPLLIW